MACSNYSVWSRKFDDIGGQVSVIPMCSMLHAVCSTTLGTQCVQWTVGTVDSVYSGQCVQWTVCTVDTQKWYRASKQTWTHHADAMGMQKGRDCWAEKKGGGSLHYPGFKPDLLTGDMHVTKEETS